MRDLFVLWTVYDEEVARPSRRVSVCTCNGASEAWGYRQKLLQPILADRCYPRETRIVVGEPASKVGWEGSD